MTTLPISVCVISGAEAHRIGRALESVAGWTSEIIVVLNEDVQDGTDKIAAEHGAKVFREPWKGHIAQKNSAAAKATQPWILGLDVDEVVSAELRQEIELTLADATESANLVAFSMPRRTRFCGRWIRHGDWYPGRKLRLWRRGSAHWGGIDPHDKLEAHGRTGRLRHDLLHYTAETVNHQILKTVAYADDFTRHCLSKDRHVSFLDLLARPCWRFVRGYFIRLGFLDGWQGFGVAWLTAFSTFLRYLKAREARMKQADQK